MSGPLLEAEESDGSGLRARVRQGHDGGAETAGPGSDLGRGRRGRLPVRADPGAWTAGGGAPGSQQHSGEEASLLRLENVTSGSGTGSMFQQLSVSPNKKTAYTEKNFKDTKFSQD